jgi:hypothetical protein
MHAAVKFQNNEDMNDVLSAESIALFFLTNE